MSGSISPELQSDLARTDDSELIPVFILARGQLDTSWLTGVTAGMTPMESRELIVEALMEMAGTAQAGIIEELGNRPVATVANVERFWLANAVYCEITADVIRHVAAREDVQLVESASCPDAGLVDLIDVHAATREEMDGIVWGVTKINADDVWAMGYNGSGIIVGVIDTGTDYNHIDLNDNMWHDTEAGYHYGWDFYDNDDDPMDIDGHGTFCSGIVAGTGTGGTQTGVAPGATCMALRINYTVSGVPSWIRDMEFGTLHGASVLSTSLAIWSGNMALRTAEMNLLTAGVFHSVAAGNIGPDPGTITSSGDSPPPWFHPDQIHHGGQSAVVTCGATTNNDEIATFSSRGPVTWWDDYSDTCPLIDPDICGPGTTITSTQLGGGYFTASGTSAATPHLAGVAALLLDANPDLTVGQIDQIIESTCVSLGEPGKDNTFGAGRVDAYQAVILALELGIEDSSVETGPANLLLGEISPNPSGSHLTFQIYAGTPGDMEVLVFDLNGRLIALIDRREIASGIHSCSWTIPTEVINGVYFIRIVLGSNSVTAKLTVIR